MNKLQRFTTNLFLFFFLFACSPAPTLTPTIAPNIALPTPQLIFPTQAPQCALLNVKPTPGPQTPSLFPPESASDYARGAESPSVTITTYIDYQDNRSAFFVNVTNQLLAKYPSNVRIVYRPLPLIGAFDKSALAAQAAEAANKRGKFWEMNDLLYAHYADWTPLSPENFKHWLIAQAVKLGLNAGQFELDLESEETIAKVQKYADDANSIGIPGTPLILINGQIYGGPRNFNSLKDIVELVLLGKRQFASCPPYTIDANKQYTATLRTDKGAVVIELFADKAPVTVNSFIYLAQNGWYNNITFHRVIPNLFAQTGDPSETGKGNPGYYVITEILPSLKFSRPGVVAMVNSGPDTSGSQFFITYAPTAQFNGQYTIFGQVVSGMDALISLAPRDPQPGTDLPPGDKLLSVEIEEK